MTNRYFDSQGLPYDNADTKRGDLAAGVMSAEDAAEWQARNDAANTDAIRFQELAPAYYWEAVEMIDITRDVLHDTDGSREWAALAATIRARVYAQIESEKNHE